jgi:hypothetical protein
VKVFRPKREELAGDWRRLRSEELHNLHSRPNIIRAIISREMRWADHVARMEAARNLYKILVGKAEVKKEKSWKTWV